jgi:hypothetical protein
MILKKENIKNTLPLLLLFYVHSIGDMAIFQGYWYGKTSGAILYIISGTSGHMYRTTELFVT